MNTHLRSSGLYIVAVMDLLAVIVCCLVALQIVAAVTGNHLTVQQYYPAIITFVAITMICSAGSYLNQSWDVAGNAVFSVTAIKKLCIVWFVIAASVALFAVLTKTNYAFSRLWFVFVCGLSFGSAIMVRLILWRLLHVQLKQEIKESNLLIIGNQYGLEVFAEKLLENQYSNFQNVTKFDWQSDTSLQPDRRLQLPVNKHQVDLVWIMGSHFIDSNAIAAIVEYFKDEMIEISYFPDFSFIADATRGYVLSRSGNLIIPLSAKPLLIEDRWLKNLFDKLFALLVLVLLSPLFLILAIGVKLSSPGVAFFRQERVTYDGKAFKIIKFRTMRVEAEPQATPVTAAGENSVTAFGAILRKTSLDELPQFVNVLIGDMSVVGPRPERVCLVKKLQNTIPAYLQKHHVRAGVTGWAQVCGYRGNTGIEKRIQHDLYYINNWSILFDIKIILMTVYTVCKSFIKPSVTPEI